MRSELRSIQKRTNVTFIYITHDQGEALAMSDRVGIMSQRRAAAGRRAAGDLQPPGQRLRRLLRRREQRLPRPGDRRHQRHRADRDRVRHLQRPARARASRKGRWPSSMCGRSTRPWRRRHAGDANALPVEVTEVAFEGNFINVHARGEVGGGLHGAGPQRSARGRCPTSAHRLHLSFASERRRRAGRRRRPAALRRRPWAS